MNIHALTGLSGVSEHENEHARRWARYFEWPMLLVALWIPAQWYLNVQGSLSHWAAVLGDWIIWSFFLLETSFLTLLVDNKTRFLKQNWMNLLIILIGFPTVWGDTPLIGVLRNLRLILLLGLLLRVSRTIKAVLSLNQLGGTLWFTGLVVLSAGFVISKIDPAIKSPSEGFWWAWVTLTTVGYGDYAPVSDEGRLFASFIMLLGVGVFAMLTANLSAFLVGRNRRRQERELRETLRKMQQQLENLEKKLDQNKNNEN
ncbi:MAG: potassium channel family protein [Gammaproteobacteria bacterium]|nr:potassium channel family protein [Gammaproteobacteria bacterium]MDH5692986.1 potassium channel family protein [Gammaproteobacteria bacterium]